MFQYGVQRPVFDVLSRDGTDLSPVTSAIYLFLTMIIVFQVWIGGASLGDNGGKSSRAVSAQFEMFYRSAVNQNPACWVTVCVSVVVYTVHVTPAFLSPH